MENTPLLKSNASQTFGKELGWIEQQKQGRQENKDHNDRHAVQEQHIYKERVQNERT